MTPDGPGRVAARVHAALRSLRARTTGDQSQLAARIADVEHEQRRSHEQLVERIERLESVVEGLQDAVHRESVRHDEMIDALARKTEPAELARALSDDARKRGL